MNQLRRKLKARDEDLRIFQEKSEDLAEAKSLLAAGESISSFRSLGLRSPRNSASCKKIISHFEVIQLSNSA